MYMETRFEPSVCASKIKFKCLQYTQYTHTEREKYSSHTTYINSITYFARGNNIMQNGSQNRPSYSGKSSCYSVHNRYTINEIK